MPNIVGSSLIYAIKTGKKALKRTIHLEMTNNEEGYENKPHIRVVDASLQDEVIIARIRIDVPEYVGEGKLSLTEKNLILYELSQIMIFGRGIKSQAITIWDACMFIWNANRSAKRISIEDMPEYSKLEIKK